MNTWVWVCLFQVSFLLYQIRLYSPPFSITRRDVPFGLCASSTAGTSLQGESKHLKNGVADPDLVLFGALLSNGGKVNAEVLDAAKSIEAMEKMIKPAIEQATDWSVKAGLGFVSASAFYALVVRVTKL